MDILRRNTDYALRAMINLGTNYGGETKSARDISEAENVSYQLTCKLLQKLSRAGFIESEMGKKGGYKLSKSPSDITVKQIVEAVQGPVLLNRCLGKGYVCEKMENCPIHKKLNEWQSSLDEEMAGTTLEDLIS